MPSAKISPQSCLNGGPLRSAVEVENKEDDEVRPIAHEWAWLVTSITDDEDIFLCMFS